jgi:hypothetical protein
LPLPGAIKSLTTPRHRNRCERHPYRFSQTGRQALKPGTTRVRASPAARRRRVPFRLRPRAAGCMLSAPARLFCRYQSGLEYRPRLTWRACRVFDDEGPPGAKPRATRASSRGTSETLTGRGRYMDVKTVPVEVNVRTGGPP